jgi:hypothetical protein
MAERWPSDGRAMIAGQGHVQDGRLPLPRPGTDVVRTWYGRGAEAGRTRSDRPRRSPTLRRSLFFDGWPALLPPDPHGLLAALGGTLDGAWHAGAQAMQAATGGRGIIRDVQTCAESLHPPVCTSTPVHACPRLSTKPVRFRPTLQERRELGPLLQRELEGGTRGWVPPLGAAAVLPLRPPPAPARATGSRLPQSPPVTPSAAAMSCCFQPASLSSQARRRRPSRQSSRAFSVFIAPTYHSFTNLYRDQ